MKQLISREEIKHLFYKKIKPRISRIEKQRKKVQTNLVLFVSVLVLVSAIMSIKTQGQGIQLILGGAAVIFGVGYQLIVKNYTKIFKHQVIKEVFEALVHDCQYIPSSKISRSLFDQSQIINSSYHEYSGDDYVKGKIGGYEVEFSEIRVIQKTRTKSSTSKKVIYQGLFFYFKLPKSLEQNTLILPDIAEKSLGKSLGRFLQKQSRSGYQLVQLESVAFEKEYVVFSNSQIKARTLLTPLIMENLTSFKKKHRAKMDLSLRGSDLFIGIRSRRNMFEPNIFGEVVNFADIREIYDLISLVRELQENLGLDDAA